ncbi:hypothetical protein TCAL_11850 [Tigriopus californicus]|uniref:CUB domain-containing protein n=1 Tax=Tigriopus californicus TaxID=6832 RepID=A0A553PTV5_TIGCA|nr:hypothetical protein TCAL_11850 [Tigriopus californicus]
MRPPQNGREISGSTPRMIVTVILLGGALLPWVVVGSEKNREEKLLNIFTLVRFQQNPCVAMGTMMGTCMTTPECSEARGTPGNPCALGFGVCCAFAQGCGEVITRNCSYIQSQDYPKPFQIDDPAVVDDATDDGTCDMDTISFTSGNGISVPTMCGTLTGQHLYMDAGGPGSTTEMSVTHAFNGGASRIFKYKVTQIPCGTTWTPPPGCSMYLTGTSGQFQSYNYNGGYHLNNQNHKICFRQEEGYCRIQYTQTDDPFSFKFTGRANSRRASSGDRFCRGDYLFIPNGRNSDCRGTLGTSHKDRFCGSVLNCIQGTTKRRTIISDVPGPFYVQYVTDARDNDFPNNNFGFSLKYMQIPC